jgi:hypothetical protein
MQDILKQAFVDLFSMQYQVFHAISNIPHLSLANSDLSSTIHVKQQKVKTEEYLAYVTL